MRFLRFDWSGRFGHFRRAEANRSAMTYPVPPRTAVLGLLACLLGHEKDRAPVTLAHLRIAWGGPIPHRFWHQVKFRKDPPSPLPWSVSRDHKAKQKTGPEAPTLQPMELMLNPRFWIVVASDGPQEVLAELEQRLRERKWHFTPCVGLSEYLADLTLLDAGVAHPVMPGMHTVQGCCPADLVKLMAPSSAAAPEEAPNSPLARPLHVTLLRMPSQVDSERNFIHRGYYLEADGRGLPVETASAWSAGDRIVVLA